MRMRISWAVVLAACTAEGTQDSDGMGAVNGEIDGGTFDPRYTWRRDVEPIVRSRCQLCHQDPPKFGAPRPFVDYEHTQELLGTAPAHEVMVFRIFADQNRMPPNTQPQLTDEEKRIIRAWSELGAPEGTATEQPDTGRDGSTVEDAGTSSRPISRTFALRATDQGGTNPYTLAMADTSYVCWSFTIPAGTTEQAFRFEPIIDNLVNTHHMLLFIDTDAGNDPGPFDCDGLPLGWNMIAGWAPGRGADELPPSAGVPMRAGEQLVPQIHYDAVTSEGITDHSGFRVLLTGAHDLVPAGVLWSGVIWESSINGSNVSRTHTCTLEEPITMFAVFPHMHRLGRRITLEVQRGGAGAWTPLVDVTGWSFEDQPEILIPSAEQQLEPGDHLRTTCWWNTMGQSVEYGVASTAEMCFNFVYHYPRVDYDFACVGFQP